ncbi:MAG: hypothetical protein PHQ95_03485 [Candidatus Gracilibacteria bacterium]|nr:hypothetical protein [Candidatus Gracilibacteria bacterium]
MNKIIIFLCFTFILFSCSSEMEDNKTSNRDVSTTEALTGVKIVSPLVNKEVVYEKRIQTFLKDVPKENSSLFTDLLIAQKTGDKIKIQELKRKIQELEKTKKKEFDATIKNGDTEKAAELKKSMRIFREIQRIDNQNL